MEETPEFEARKHRPTLREIITSIGQNFGLVLGGMALVVMTTVSFYLITAYTPTFGKTDGGDDFAQGRAMFAGFELR